MAIDQSNVDFTFSWLGCSKSKICIWLVNSSTTCRHLDKCSNGIVNKSKCKRTVFWWTRLSRASFRVALLLHMLHGLVPATDTRLYDSSRVHKYAFPLSSFPGLPCFYLPLFVFTIIHGSERPVKNREDLGAFITWMGMRWTQGECITKLFFSSSDCHMSVCCCVNLCITTTSPQFLFFQWF